MLGRLVREHGDDIRLSRFISAFFVIEAANIAVKTVFSVSPKIWSTVSFGFATILVVWFASVVRIVLRRSLLLFIMAECGWTCLYLVSFLMGNASPSLLLEKAFWTLGACIPIAVCVHGVQDRRVLYDALNRCSYYVTAILLPVFGFLLRTSTNSMSFSYALVLPVLFRINDWFRTHKTRHIVLGATQVFAILLVGARGPLLCVLMMLVLKILQSGGNRRLKVVAVLVGGAVLALVALFQDRIRSVGWVLAERYGYLSRTLLMISMGKFVSDSGRVGLFERYLELISQKPISGWGVVGGWITDSGPHSILLELLLAFGCFFGGVACLFVITLWFRPLFVRDDQSLKDLLLIFSSRISTMYLLSGDLVSSVPFFTFAVLCFDGFTLRGATAHDRNQMVHSYILAARRR